MKTKDIIFELARMQYNCERNSDNPFSKEKAYLIKMEILYPFYGVTSSNKKNKKVFYKDYKEIFSFPLQEEKKWPSEL